MAMSYRLHCYAKGLLECGAQLRVVTPRSKKSKEGKLFFFKDIFDGVKYKILFNRSFKGLNLVNYILKELDPFLLVLYCIINIRKYDIFWLIKFGVLANIMCIPILHLFGKKVVFEVNENPYSTVGSKLTRIRWINNLLRKLTFNWIYPQVDGFIVISENLRQLILPCLKKNALILKVPILIDVEKKIKTSLNRSLPTKNPYLFHAGSLSTKKDGIIEVFKAYTKACSILGPNIKLDFVITNKVTLPHVWTEIQEVIRVNNLADRIIVTGYLGDDEMDYMMKHASVSVINKPVNDQNLYNFPTKIGEYLRCGVPIVIGAEKMELLEYLANYDNAIITSPNNVDGLRDGIVHILQDVKLSKKLSKQGIITAKRQFSYKIHGARLFKFFNKWI